MSVEAFANLTLARKLRVEELCRDYENAWYDETPPSLSAFMKRVAPDDIDDCLRELLATDFELRLNERQDLPVNEYLQQFPEHTELIDSVYHEVVNESLSAPSAPNHSLLGMRIGDFQIVRELGRGGMGIVYEALQETLQRRVALKVLPPGLEDDSERVARFGREALAIARLHHEHIVEIYGAGQTNGTHFIAMQFVAGESLDCVLNRAANRREFSESTFVKSPTTTSRTARAHAETVIQREPVSADDTAGVGVRGGQSETDTDRSRPTHPAPLVTGAAGRSPQEPRRGATSERRDINFAPELGRTVAERARKVGQVGQQMASALSYAHMQGVLHRDVKPSNILLDDRGNAWLTDFGLAKVSESNTALTSAGSVVGTFKYIAPETLSGQTDQRSDVYSLGLTLYELLCGQPAFDSSDHSQLLKLILTTDPQRLTKLVPSAPRDLVTIIHKSIDREPSGRYQTSAELADDLRRFLNDEPIRGRQVSLVEQYTRWTRSNRLLAALLMIVSVLVTSVAIGSTVAASYFRSLSGTLNTTVGELTTATNDLTSAKNQAEKDATENLRLAQAAETQRQYSQSVVADMQTERGLLASEQGDVAGAMLWFATAAGQTPHDPQRQMANRIRSRNAMNQIPMPVASIPLTRSGAMQRLEFQPSFNRTPQARAFPSETDAAAKNSRVSSSFNRTPQARAFQDEVDAAAQNARACGVRLNELLLTVVGGRVEIWDWRTEQVLPWTRDADIFTDACWFPDGRHVAIGLKTGEVQVRSVPAGDVTQTFMSKGSIESLTCSADGQRLAVSGDVVQVWKFSPQDSQQPVLEHEWAHPQKVHLLIFNRAGDRLATSCKDNFVRVFAVGGSTEQPAPLFDPVAHVRDVGIGIETPPVFQSDRVLVVVARKPGGGSLLASIDATSGAAINGRPPLSVPAVGGLIVSRDGQWLAAATSNSCELISPLGERLALKHPHQVHDVAFGPDGALLTACFDSHAYLRTSPRDQFTPAKIPQLRPVERCVFSEDGSLVALADRQVLRVWRRPIAHAMQLAAPGWESGQWRPRPGFDGELVTRGRWHAMANAPKTLNEASVLKVQTGQPAGPTIRLDKIVDTCLCAVSSSAADQRLVAVVSLKDNAGILSFYDVSTGQLQQPPIDLPAPPQSVAARPGQPQVAVLCENGALLVFAIHEGRRLHELTHANWPWGHPFRARFPRVTWSPDGAALITVTSNGEVFVRDAETGRERFAPIQLRLKGGICPASDISSDSRLLVTAITGENSVQVWDLQTGEARCPPIPHPGDFWGLFAVQFSPDGKRVMSANNDGRVRVWDWQKQTLACPPLQHLDEVFDVAFTSDGQHGLAITRASKLHVWELTTGKRIAAPIHYPTPDNGSTKTIFTVAVVGDRAIVGAPDFPVLDLSKLLSEPSLTIESLQALAELSSARRIQLGEANSLTADEWQVRWRQQAK